MKNKLFRRLMPSSLTSYMIGVKSPVHFPSNSFGATGNKVSTEIVLNEEDSQKKYKQLADPSNLRLLGELKV